MTPAITPNTWFDAERLRGIKIGTAVRHLEKKEYRKLWLNMIYLQKSINRLIKKGKYHKSLKKLIAQVSLLEKDVLDLEKSEIRRWDELRSGLFMYIKGTTIENVSCPSDQSDKKWLAYPYRLDSTDMRNFGLKEARDLVKEIDYRKQNRLEITKKILLVCKAMKKDIESFI